MIDRNFLQAQMEAQGLSLPDGLFEKLDFYARLLVEWNEKINLTAITDPEGIVVKHFVDSLLLAKAAELPQNASLIDVGTGAGFPSVPVGLYRPDLRITLLDSLNKRILFLQELTASLGMHANVHSRAEDAGKEPAFREQYDIATARAVANLWDLSEYCLPFVKVGGLFVALKGYEIEEELSEAKYAITQMGGQVEDVRKYDLGEEARRAIVLIRKVRQTPAKYPRPAAKMKKSPLISR
ncbi:MAG: 16S rRNA (guanine(527)-N(7))-methyltransferase RsmG [Candidatus Merdivicinus sp.]|jgi:16S rRNA (guanine527-N7)-methyltransferase